ncbi:type 1 fimbrial protein [Pantoea sp. B9002]|uniref:fimbrial protein n=1 Tax=Pantoea sp. B9002 TaxID=2726979 RepID=UPI0015A0CDDE|nr:fimbrial protein [Pantoea sp. B9002]NWA62460.1 type 1 fimbrial protein [Pantoea sp. B9002]
MINKKIIFTAITSVLLSNVAFANETGTVTMSGNVSGATCQVPLDQLTRTIDFSELTTAQILEKADSESISSKNIDFDVTGCPTSVTNVGVKFDFTADASNPKYLANNGDAEGVAFGVTDAADTLINNGDEISASNYNTGTGTAQVNAKIQAYRVGNSTPVEGLISSTAIVTLVTQ